MRTILKLGGSLITDKSEPETVDYAALSRAIETIATNHRAEDDLVLVHGGGSFGHYYAERYGVSRTDGSSDAVAVTEIHRAMGELNDTVLASCHERNVEAVPVRPLSVAHRDTAGTLSFPSGTVECLLEEGFVPVVHGDVIGHAGTGTTVLSGDEIVVSLAQSLDADRVGLCSTVPGVLDDDGTVIDEVYRYEAVESVLGDSEAADVTGGMAGKVRALLELDVPAAVFGPDELARFLDTGTAGTVVRG